MVLLEKRFKNKILLFLQAPWMRGWRRVSSQCRALQTLLVTWRRMRGKAPLSVWVVFTEYSFTASHFYDWTKGLLWGETSFFKLLIIVFPRVNLFVCSRGFCDIVVAIRMKISCQEVREASWQAFWKLLGHEICLLKYWKRREMVWCKTNGREKKTLLSILGVGVCFYMTTWYAWLNVLYVKSFWGDLCGSVDRVNCSSTANTLFFVTHSLNSYPNLHVFLSRGHEMEMFLIFTHWRGYSAIKIYSQFKINVFCFSIFSNVI